MSALRWSTLLAGYPVFVLASEVTNRSPDATSDDDFSSRVRFCWRYLSVSALRWPTLLAGYLLLVLGLDVTNRSLDATSGDDF